MSAPQTPCACPPGKCDAQFGLDDRGGCIYRLEGDVQPAPCPVCRNGATWHQDGSCLRCRAIAERRFVPFVAPGEAQMIEDWAEIGETP